MFFIAVEASNDTMGINDSSWLWILNRYPGKPETAQSRVYTGSARELRSHLRIKLSAEPLFRCGGERSLMARGVGSPRNLVCNDRGGERSVEKSACQLRSMGRGV